MIVLLPVCSSTGPSAQPSPRGDRTSTSDAWGSTGDAALVGRLTDLDGMAVAGATILVFPAAEPGRPAASREAGVEPMFRTDADGGFVALLPPGRYTVAAMKDGYDIALTEAHSLSSRVVRMKMRRIAAGARPVDAERGAEWLLRPQQPDVLRDEGRALPVQVVLLQPPHEDAAPETGGSSGSAAPARFLGQADGEVLQLFGAGVLPGLEGTSGGDAVRDTTLSIRAPLTPALSWSVAGRSLRNPSVPSLEEPIAGRTDRLALGLALDGDTSAALRGRVRAGYAEDAAGGARLSDRVVEAEGDLRLADSGPRLAVALQMWDTRVAEARIDPVEGSPIASGTGAGSSGEGTVYGEGAAVYAGSRARVRDADVDYGFEYRADTLTGRPRVVPRLGIGYAPPGSALQVRADLLLDATSPGARCAVEGAAWNNVRMAATVVFLPANALDAVAPAAASDPASRVASAAVAPAGARSADRREASVAVSRSFGGFSGSLSATLGRTGRRAVPLVEDGPVPMVSYGDERFSETRLGVGYARTSTRMELGLRRVAPAEAATAAGQADGPSYRRMDLLVAQGLPAPRALSGARLEALVAWQGLDYEDLDAGTGPPLTGLASRLTGGVGLSF